VNNLLGGKDAVFVICKKQDAGALDAPGSSVIAHSGIVLIVGNRRAASSMGTDPNE
jgi:hypothetical protein